MIKKLELPNRNKGSIGSEMAIVIEGRTNFELVSYDPVTSKGKESFYFFGVNSRRLYHLQVTVEDSKWIFKYKLSKSDEPFVNLFSMTIDK